MRAQGTDCVCWGTGTKNFISPFKRLRRVLDPFLRNFNSATCPLKRFRPREPRPSNLRKMAPSRVGAASATAREPSHRRSPKRASVCLTCMDISRFHPRRWRSIFLDVVRCAAPKVGNSQKRCDVWHLSLEGTGDEWRCCGSAKSATHSLSLGKQLKQRNLPFTTLFSVRTMHFKLAQNSTVAS